MRLRTGTLRTNNLAFREEGTAGSVPSVLPRRGPAHLDGARPPRARAGMAHLALHCLCAHAAIVAQLHDAAAEPAHLPGPALRLPQQLRNGCTAPQQRLCVPGPRAAAPRLLGLLLQRGHQPPQLRLGHGTTARG